MHCCNCGVLAVFGNAALLVLMLALALLLALVLLFGFTLDRCAGVGVRCFRLQDDVVVVVAVACIGATMDAFDGFVFVALLDFAAIVADVADAAAVALAIELSLMLVVLLLLLLIQVEW